MNLQEARLLAVAEMKKWNLIAQGWGFMFNNRKRSFGVCNYEYKEIQLSRVTTEHETEEHVLNTIRHEIAHALAGSAAGHGPIWKRYAVMVGAKPKARSKSSEETQKVIAESIKYVMVCPEGEVVKTYLRTPSAKVYKEIHLYKVKGKPSTKGKLKIEKFNPSKHVLKV